MGSIAFLSKIGRQLYFGFFWLIAQPVVLLIRLLHLSAEIALLAPGLVGALVTLLCWAAPLSIVLIVLPHANLDSLSFFATIGVWSLVLFYALVWVPLISPLIGSLVFYWLVRAGKSKYRIEDIQPKPGD